MKKHELPGVACMLTLMGGFLDAYTYTCRDGVFANAQTGNVVKLGIALANGDGWLVLRYIIPIMAFILGVLISMWFCRHHFGRQYILVIEGIILAIVSLIPSSLLTNLLANVLVSFVCAMQAEAFRKVSGLGYASTMCTGNLRSMTECLENFFVMGDRESWNSVKRYMIILVCFVSGVIAGIWLTNQLSICAINLLFIPLSLALFQMTFPEKVIGFSEKLDIR